MKKTFIISAFIAFLAASSPFTTAFANTQELKDPGPGGGMSIVATDPNTVEPQFLIYQVKPGGTIQDEVTVQNDGAATQLFSLYAADYTLTKDLLRTYKTKSDPKLFAAKWFQLQQDTVTLGPKEKKIIPITINVPGNTPLQDFYAGIALEKIVPSANHPNIKFAYRVVLPVNITVTNNPQPIPHLNQINGTDNILSMASTPYLWISLAMFTGCMGYYLYERKKEKKNVGQQSKK